MNNLSNHWFLQQIDIFKEIPDEELLKISKKITGKNCKKGEHLYNVGQLDQYIYILKKGEITLYHSFKGKKIIIEVLKPGSIFGNLSFDKTNKTHYAKASKDSYMCVFTVNDFLAVIQAKPEIMIKFLQIISNKMQSYEETLKENLLDAKTKIIKQLKKLEDQEKHRKETLLGKVFGSKTKITHEKLAELTGLSRETVTRSLNQLKKEGIEI